MKAKAKKRRRLPQKPRAHRKKPVQEKKAAGIAHTLGAYGTELDKNPETIKKALLRLDYRPQPNELIPLKAVIAALFGEDYVEKVRAMRLDNEERERNALRDKGKLLEWDAMELFWMQRFVNPMIAALDAAPKEVDREWIEKVLKPLLRQKLSPDPAS